MRSRSPADGSVAPSRVASGLGPLRRGRGARARGARAAPRRASTRCSRRTYRSGPGSRRAPPSRSRARWRSADVARLGAGPRELAEACRTAEEARDRASRAGSWTSWPRSPAGRARAPDRLPVARDPAACRFPPGSRCSSCTPASRGRSTASAYAERRRACERLAATKLGLRGAPRRDRRAGRRRAARPSRRQRERTRARLGAARSARATSRASGACWTRATRACATTSASRRPSSTSSSRSSSRAGALGARLTGAGFGGCVVAVCAEADADGIARAATARYASARAASRWHSGAARSTAQGLSSPCA